MASGRCSSRLFGNARIRFFEIGIEEVFMIPTSTILLVIAGIVLIAGTFIGIFMALRTYLIRARAW
jgi:hypothetical protein